MLVASGMIEDARQLFDKMPVKDCYSWAVMVAGCIDNDNYEESINLFVEMRCSHHRRDHKNGNMLVFPYSWITVCVLKACVHTMNLGLGKQIHGMLSKMGDFDDVFVSSSLMNF